METTNKPAAAAPSHPSGAPDVGWDEFGTAPPAIDGDRVAKALAAFGHASQMLGRFLQAGDDRMEEWFTKRNAAGDELRAAIRAATSTEAPLAASPPTAVACHNQQAADLRARLAAAEAELVAWRGGIGKSGRCSRCHETAPNPDGCALCNVPRLTERLTEGVAAIAEVGRLRVRVAELERTVEDRNAMAATLQTRLAGHAATINGCTATIEKLTAALDQRDARVAQLEARPDAPEGCYYTDPTRKPNPCDCPGCRTVGHGGRIKPAPFDLATFFDAKARWSIETFGPGDRYAGVCAHIRKELLEIEAEPSEPIEWIDVVLLAMDGAWRSAGLDGAGFVATLRAKDGANRMRRWPDWRTLAPGQVSEHIREPAPAQTAPITVERLAPALMDEALGPNEWQGATEGERAAFVASAENILAAIAAADRKGFV